MTVDAMQNLAGEQLGVGAAFGVAAAVRQSMVGERAHRKAVIDPLAYAVFYDKWFASAPSA
jgi:hypothetical protein